MVAEELSLGAGQPWTAVKRWWRVVSSWQPRVAGVLPFFSDERSLSWWVTYLFMFLRPNRGPSLSVSLFEQPKRSHERPLVAVLSSPRSQ